MLTSEQKEWVRSEFLGGRSQASIARELGVSDVTIGRFLRDGRKGYGPLAVSSPIPAGNVKEIEGWPGYLVSDCGVVYSRLYGSRSPLVQRWKKVTQSLTRDGYFQVRLHNGAKSKLTRVHTLVLNAFVGPCPAGMQACHNDGNKVNNQSTNLRWDTAQANINDRELHGRTARGCRNGNSKLTEQQVREVRAKRLMGIPRKIVAKEFGICESQVKRICNGYYWKSLTAI